MADKKKLLDTYIKVSTPEELFTDAYELAKKTEARIIEAEKKFEEFPKSDEIVKEIESKIKPPKDGKTSTTYQIKEAELTVKYHNEMKTVVNKETGVESEVEVSVPYHKEVVEVTSIDKETGDTVVKTKVIEVPDVKVISVGSVEARATKKDTALKIMKELIEQNKKDYVIEIVKEVTDGQKYAGYGKYTPSKSAKLGKFIFFVQE